ncbi:MULTISPECIES: GPP34 family phosphoprotein [unclassified Streptomyces]|uniref:GOLPH3/VPS74 family protein n=1 Tax=unclassified Streptomyces TaxID=2593676 RepID=UPI0035DA2B4E
MNPALPEHTLPEELLLLALDPRLGKPYCRNRFLEYGVAGAVLAELELHGRIAEHLGRIRVISPQAPQDPLLAQVLGSLPAPDGGGLAGGVGAKAWIRRTGRYVEELCLEHLVGRAVLRRETHRLLGLLPYHRHPAADPALPAAVRERFAATEAAGFPDRRSRTLAALVSATGLSDAVAQGGWRSRSTMHDLVRDEWTAYAVRRNVRQDKANRSGSGTGGGGGGDD